MERDVLSAMGNNKSTGESVVIPICGITHAGVFHADDVFATAVLVTLNPCMWIQRSYEVPAGFDGIVYDMGGGEFDHHVGRQKKRDDGVPYASFGLVWRRFGHLLLCDEDARDFDENFVQPIDLADSTGSSNILSQCVSDFNPQSGVLADFDVAFWEAVAWACDVLRRRIDSIQYARNAVNRVRQLMKNGDGAILVLDQVMPWKRAMIGSGYAYVVYPSPRGGYNAQCVPRQRGDGSMVRPFPESWRGRSDRELQEATGVEGARFCHRSGFLCAADTKDAVTRLARKALACNNQATNTLE